MVAYVVPPPVPALRIVKRANVNANTKFQHHHRAASTPNIGGSSATAAGHSSISAPRPPLPPIPVQQKPVHKPTLRGVQRPRPSKAATVAGPPKLTFGLGSKIIKPSEKASVDAAAGNSKFNLGRPISMVESSVTGKNSAGEPSRHPIAPAAASKGLRQPSRFGYGGAASSGGSALPKPISSVAGATSRLPGPSSTQIINKVGNSVPSIGASRTGGRRV
jgi:hypothetical protein